LLEPPGDAFLAGQTGGGRVFSALQVPGGTHDPARVAGVYTFLFVSSGTDFDFGTLRMEEGNTFALFARRDEDATPDLAGTWADDGDGTIRIQTDAGGGAPVEVGTLAFGQRANGKVLIGTMTTASGFARDGKLTAYERRTLKGAEGGLVARPEERNEKGKEDGYTFRVLEDGGDGIVRYRLVGTTLIRPDGTRVRLRPDRPLRGMMASCRFKNILSGALGGITGGLGPGEGTLALVCPDGILYAVSFSKDVEGRSEVSFAVGVLE
jgi:hypothetical protein